MTSFTQADQFWSFDNLFKKELILLFKRLRCLSTDINWTNDTQIRSAFNCIMSKFVLNVKRKIDLLNHNGVWISLDDDYWKTIRLPSLMPRGKWKVHSLREKRRRDGFIRNSFTFIFKRHYSRLLKLQHHLFFQLAFS